jgi:ribonuclease HI
MKPGAKNKFYAVIFQGEANIYHGTWDEINAKFISGKSVTHKSFTDQTSAKKWIDDILTAKPTSSVSNFSSTVNNTPNFQFNSNPNPNPAFHFGSPPNFNFSPITAPVFNPIVASTFNPSTSSIPSQEKFVAYTDGSFTSRIINKEKVLYGGWAYVIVRIINNTSEIIKRNSGKVSENDIYDVKIDPTNNRAELMAIAMLLSDDLISKVSDIYSDSKYAISSITEWYFNWQRNGWKTSTGDDVKNKHLIERIINSKRNLNVNFIHVYGHTGNHYNEIVDKMAKEAAFA